MSAPIPLRAHHLLCILTYKGTGYTPTFTANMTRIVGAIQDGVEIILRDGPDAICAGLTVADADHCHCSEPDTARMDGHAKADLASLLPMGRAFRLSPADIAHLRLAFASDSIRRACTDCSWNAFCTEIAQSGFAGTMLSPGASVASR